jgi:hypothetical protein
MNKKNPLDRERASALGHRSLEMALEAGKARRAKSAITPASRNSGLFLSEDEIAKRLGQQPSEWRSKVRVLERDGFPRIDALMGGRYWPAIIAWWNRRYGLTNIDISQPDGRDNLDVLRR